MGVPTDYSSCVCDQAGDKHKDKRNTRGLAILRGIAERLSKQSGVEVDVC